MRAHRITNLAKHNMKATIEEKIVRVNALLSERNRIDTELAEIFGEPVSAIQAGEPRQKRKYTKRVDIENMKKPERERKCGQCGKPGHMRKTCPGSPGFEERQNQESVSVALNKNDFDVVRERAQAEVSRGDIAEEVGCDLREVNLAIIATSFLDYIKRRKHG